MKKISKFFYVLVLFAIVATGCTSVNKTMREPASRVNFVKDDFTFSAQVSAEAQTTKILGIDWKRLMGGKGGEVSGGAMAISVSSIPVIGGLVADKTASYALFNLMNENTGYDVVFYPSFETKVEKPIIGIGLILTKTTVTATARLGKIK
jgi:hypothetical protein